MGCCGIVAVGNAVLGTVAVGSAVWCQAAQLAVHTIENEKIGHSVRFGLD